IHSDADLGVVIQPLQVFLQPEDYTTYFADDYRINQLESAQASKAISNAKALLGQPYNTTYIFEDEGYYC
ncbi:YiiX/YebB-like N1pC/P60 family cysteine hydrolase, partial [Mesoflavibacter profundi]|uniref:YiiX/YebB-like N1pC/P60 family cysteine hydrolase n=1 Tax=Mesoflavibacter profundi TaxID=2708110 RepID=UPI003514105E